MGEDLSEGDSTVYKNDDKRLSMLKDEVSDEEYRYAVKEFKKKKNIGYWIKIAIPVAVILAILIIYYCLYQ